MREYLNNPDPQYYERRTICETRLGYVSVEELDWAHNLGKNFFTYFKIIIDKIEYSAFLEEARLSDIQRRWLATNFVNQIKIDNKVLGCSPICERSGRKRI